MGREEFVDDLQKDLHLYMVNIFSISVARVVLFAASKRLRTDMGKVPSLGCQLKEYCGAGDAYKQLCSEGGAGDWRERPLDSAKEEVACMEVRYLLHLYHRFRNMLIDHNLLNKCYLKCNKVGKSVWVQGKGVHGSYMHMALYKRMCTGGLKDHKIQEEHKVQEEHKEEEHGHKMVELNQIQMEAFRSLYHWRHTTAQKHDESCNYLLRDHAMYRLARDLPKDAEGISKSLSPDTACPLLEENMEHICELVSTAVDQVSGKPNAQEKITFSNKRKKNNNSRKWRGEKRKKQFNKPQTFGSTGPQKTTFMGKPRY